MLQSLYHQLAQWYELDAPYRIADFLITDRARLAGLPTRAPLPDADELLLISEDDNGLHISLFLDESVLDGLSALADAGRPDRRAIHHYWLAVEGVSHFLYLTWRGGHNRCLTRLEMELQAEIDKYLCTVRLLRPQPADRSLAHLHHLLFEQTRFHQAPVRRYAEANRYAAKYCLTLQAQLRAGPPGRLLNDLRRFYRLSQNDKIRHIQSLP